MINKKAQIEPRISPAPTENRTTESIPEKKSKWWIWVIVGVVLLIVLGVGVYYLLSGSSGGYPTIGNNVPRPPALPD